MTKTSRRSFGKELDAVLGASQIMTNGADSTLNLEKELINVMVHNLIPSRYQPRRIFSPESLQELSDSIKKNGILQPIIARKVGQDYEIIAGERRWRAAQMAGLQQVPILVCKVNDESVAAFSLIENIQRENLNPIEEARALQRLIDEFRMTHEQVAKAIGRSRTMVTNTLRLLNLTDPLKKMLDEKVLEMGHARALLSLSDIQQIDVAHIVIQKKLSVRETEKIVRKISSPPKHEANIQPEFLEWARRSELQLSQKISSQATIQIDSKGSGKLIIYFKAREEIDLLVRNINDSER